MEPLDGAPPPSVAPEPGTGARLRGHLWSALARWSVAYVALTTAVVTTIRTHWFFIRPYATPMGIDEGYITALSQRLILGHWLPYVDGVSQRGPMTYWLSAVAMRVGGLFSWMPLRVLSLGMALATLALVFLLGLELFSPFVAAVAVLVQAYLSNYELNPWDGVGYNGEIATMPFLLASALLVARTQNRPEGSKRGGPGSRARAAWLVTAGVLSAFAALTKQIALIHTIPAILWLLAGPRQATGEAARKPDLASYGVGFALPFAAVLAVYLATGHVADFIYYYQRYGRDVYMAPITLKYALEELHREVNKYSLGISGVTLVTLFAMARATASLLTPPTEGAATGPGFWARAVSRARRSAPILFVLLHFFGALAGATFPFRFFGHYYLEVYPFLGLVAGYAVSQSFDRMDENHASTVLAGLVVVIGATALLVMADSALQRNVIWRRGLERWDRWYQDPQTDPVVRYVLSTTNPSDTIFVWGFRSETHVSARRIPASRFVYSIYPSGFVPWFRDATRAEEAGRVVPGSQALLIRDLEESQPELIIDAGDMMYDRYMRDIPVFRRYLDERYCLMGEVEAEPVYRRRHGDDCPSPTPDDP